MHVIRVDCLNQSVVHLPSILTMEGKDCSSRKRESQLITMPMKMR